MLKRWIALSCLILLVGLNVIFPFPKITSATQAESSGVLLMYDSFAMGTPKEGNIEAIQRLLASFGIQVTLQSDAQYEAGTLHNYTKVIEVRNVEDVTQLPDSYWQDMNTYNGDYMHIGNQLPAFIRHAMNIEEQQQDHDTVSLVMNTFSQDSINVDNMTYITKFSGKSYGEIKSENSDISSPYGVIYGKYAYIPYLVKGNLSEQAASFVLTDWLSVKPQSHYYLMLNEIYPFSDLALLREMADRLYNAGIPFIASVQPVFGNQDFPAMQRYLEVIKYIQSRNGSIVINSPVVESTTSPDVLGLKSQMDAFLNVLAGYGIVPLGVSSELYWTYDQHYSENALSYFNSGVILPNNSLRYRSQTATSSVFISSLYTMKAEELYLYKANSRILNPLPMDTAIVYPFPKDRLTLEDNLTTIIADWIRYSDYKNEVHTVRTTANEMTSQNGHLLINGDAVVMNNNLQEIDPEHTYVQQTQKSFTELFSVQNNIFIVLILTTLLIFMAFLIIGYQLYKRKFKHQGRSL